MPAGRPKKPAALRIVEGNRSKRPVPAEVSFGTDAPERPAYLDGDARAKWDDLAVKLHSAGLLQSVDADALAAYCVAFAQWREATKLLDDYGLTMEAYGGGVQMRPEVKIQKNALASMQQLMAQFGLSPKARANLGTTGLNKPPVDPFTEAMGG